MQGLLLSLKMSCVDGLSVVAWNAGLEGGQRHPSSSSPLPLLTAESCRVCFCRYLSLTLVLVMENYSISDQWHFIPLCAMRCHCWSNNRFDQAGSLVTRCPPCRLHRWRSVNQRHSANSAFCPEKLAGGSGGRPFSYASLWFSFFVKPAAVLSSSPRPLSFKVPLPFSCPSKGSSFFSFLSGAFYCVSLFFHLSWLWSLAVLSSFDHCPRSFLGSGPEPRQGLL